MLSKETREYLDSICAKINTVIDTNNAQDKMIPVDVLKDVFATGNIDALDAYLKNDTVPLSAFFMTGEEYASICREAAIFTPCIVEPISYDIQALD